MMPKNRSTTKVHLKKRDKSRDKSRAGKTGGKTSAAKRKKLGVDSAFGGGEGRQPLLRSDPYELGNAAHIDADNFRDDYGFHPQNK